MFLENTPLFLQVDFSLKETTVHSVDPLLQELWLPVPSAGDLHSHTAAPEAKQSRYGFIMASVINAMLFKFSNRSSNHFRWR